MHPESYAAAQTLLGLCGYRLADVGALTELPARLEAYGPARAAEACGIGLPTLRDIVREPVSYTHLEVYKRQDYAFSQLEQVDL